MIRRVALPVIFLLLASPVIAQNTEIDSLQKTVKELQDSEAKVDALNALASALYDYDNRIATVYANQAYDLGRTLQYPQGIRKALVLRGFNSHSNGNHEQALEYYRKASSIQKIEDDLEAYNFVLTGNVFRSMANYDSAEYYYKRALEIERRIGSKTYLAYGLKNLGRLFVLQWKNKEAEEAFKTALSIYEESKYKKGIADTWFSLSEVSKNQSEFGKANQYIDEGCALSDEIKDEFLKVQCLINRGNIKYRLGEYPESLKLCFEALGILKYKDMPLMLASLYSNIGDIYRALGQKDFAMRYYTESLKIAERVGIKYEIAKLYTAIAGVLKDDKKFSEAREYIDKSFTLRTEIHDEQGIALSYSVLGMIYYGQKQYDEALKAFERSLEIRKRFNDKEGISSSMFNLSQVYIQLDQYPKALELVSEALAVEEAMGNKYNMGFSNNRLGSIYTRLKKFPKAEIHLRKAQQIASEINSMSLRSSIEFNWSQYYDAIGSVGDALKHYRLYTAAQDSLYSDISAQKLAELQALYQIEQKDQEILLLNKENSLREQEITIQRTRINQQTIIIVSIVAGLLLVSILAVMTYRYNVKIQKANREITEQKEEIQSQSEELIEANSTIADINRELEKKIDVRTQALTQAYKELDTFFYRASHDFRRPLTTFLGLAEVANVTVKDPNALELFDKVRETAINLDKMLIKLQSISDVGSQELIYKEVMIKEIFDNVCDSFREELLRKNIKTSCELKLTHPFISYPAMVKIVIENLVENAIHFCGFENPYIKLHAYASGRYVTIDIQDNGQGIAPEYHEPIFDMYFRGSERSKGNGLGLYIVKKAVQKLEGSITLSSIAGRGSTFTLMLPNNL
jgi:signal transduction histidine kinase